MTEKIDNRIATHQVNYSNRAQSREHRFICEWLSKMGIAVHLIVFQSYNNDLHKKTGKYGHDFFS